MRVRPNPEREVIVPPKVKWRRPPRRTMVDGRYRPRLYLRDVLAWADAHRERTGQWPIAGSGEVQEAPWDTWRKIDDALRQGYRGWRQGGSLAKLLLRHRGKRPRVGYWRRPRLCVKDILRWADAYHKRTGDWPTTNSPGYASQRPRNTWPGLNHALSRGTRGLPGQDSLAGVLLRFRDVRRAANRARLTGKQILAWADAFHAKHGRWPSTRSGAVEGVPGERWSSIHAALERGQRGLPRGYTLATLLRKYRGHRYRRHLPPYTTKKILAWADAHHHKKGKWPSLRTGPIAGAPGETWNAVESALTNGRRGFPGGESLAEFLDRHGRKPLLQKPHHAARHGLLSVERILAWVDEFHERHERWPTRLAGRIAGTRDETWLSVDSALRLGLRGLPRGSSLTRLLAARRALRSRSALPNLHATQILAWADAFHAREKRWPAYDSGVIRGADGETWCGLDNALRRGARGLPPGGSLRAFLLARGRGARTAGRRGGRARVRPAPRQS